MGSHAPSSAHAVPPTRRIAHPAHRRAAFRRIAEFLPDFYRRSTQLAIDGGIGFSAVLLGYQFRFDFNVPSSYTRGMWTWAAVIAVLRPAILVMFGAYNNLWRLFCLKDGITLLQASVPPSLLLLVLQTLRQTTTAARVPSGVLGMEFAMFLGLSAGVRSLRRALYHRKEPSYIRRKRALTVDPETVLNRRSAPLRPSPEVLDAFRSRTVLITGAGGSIGSELSRQVSQFGISRLILLDQDENAVFEVHRDLSGEPTEVVPAVGTVRDNGFVRHVFAEYRPHIVLHAAAFKHVPMMEPNASEAVLNNIVGTRVVADAAAEFGSERFILISSDKAVEPTSIMGASKRLGEMLVQVRAIRSRGTRFASVRFGNVAGSRGSVIPIFQRQIAEGMPITITDQRMSRYFMTREEAVSLVLQASSLAQAGEIYVLEMGEPINITDLAHNLIKRLGLIPGKDVPLKNIGIRAGEKLYEKLWCDGERVCPTRFRRIRSIAPEPIPSDLESQISDLEQIAKRRRNTDLRAKLHAMPIGYRPQSQRAEE